MDNFWLNGWRKEQVKESNYFDIVPWLSEKQDYLFVGVDNAIEEDYTVYYICGERDE